MTISKHLGKKAVLPFSLNTDPQGFPKLINLNPEHIYASFLFLSKPKKLFKFR